MRSNGFVFRRPPRSRPGSKARFTFLFRMLQNIARRTSRLTHRLHSSAGAGGWLEGSGGSQAVPRQAMSYTVQADGQPSCRTSFGVVTFRNRG